MLNATGLNTELLTIAQAKDYLKCSHVFILKCRKEGKIRAVNAGRKVLIVKSSIDEYLNLYPKEVTHG